MPTATLSFNLPEEQSEFDLSCKGGDLSAYISDLHNFIRGKLKYNADNCNDAELKVYQSVLDRMSELTIDYNVSSIVLN